MAEISIDGTAVKMLKNESNHYRGLHLVIIDPDSGKVVTNQVYDTYKSSDALEAVILKNMR